MLRRRRNEDAPTDPPSMATSPDRPPPLDGARNLVVVVLDSLRYDSWTSARMENAANLGAVERRWSYASWTAPSHYNLLLGLLPHRNATHVFAAEQYADEYRRFSDRLGVPDLDLSNFLPALHLPTFLRRQLGYRTHARVSMPVLNPSTPINLGF